MKLSNEKDHSIATMCQLMRLRLNALMHGKDAKIAQKASEIFWEINETDKSARECILAYWDITNSLKAQYAKMQ